MGFELLSRDAEREFDDVVSAFAFLAVLYILDELVYSRDKSQVDLSLAFDFIRSISGVIRSELLAPILL